VCDTEITVKVATPTASLATSIRANINAVPNKGLLVLEYSISSSAHSHVHDSRPGTLTL